MVTITTNENGQVSREFKNKEGQIICKDEAVNDATKTTRTYYVYDDLGRLRFVIQPKAEAELKNKSLNSLVDFNPSSGDYFLKNLVFSYNYDERGLLIEQAVPGMARFKQMIYNKRDQLVLTVGALTYNSDNRTYNKYDDLNRLVSSGIYTGNEAVDVIRTNAQDNITWPTTNTNEFLKNYYDNLTTTNYPSADQVAFNTSGYQSSYSTTTQGKLVGTKSNIIHYNGTIINSASYDLKRIDLISTNYYDNQGRLVQIASKNHKDGFDYTHTKYDFIGRVVANKTTTEYKHWTTNTTSTLQARTIETKSTYNVAGRIQSVCQKNDSDNWEPVQRNTYNGIGELISKLQGCSLQKVDYTYNIRGWLTDLNDLSNFTAQATSNNPDLFAMHLDYNGTGQFVGNITGQQWRTLVKQNATPTVQESYTYTYDNLNRILTGTYVGDRGGLTTEVYGSTPYDKNGNIQKLRRTKVTGATSTVVDDLKYTYNNGANTLQKIIDDGDKNLFFKEPAIDETDYVYNWNGSLTVDRNKYYDYKNGYGGISYNALNLVSQVSSNHDNPDVNNQVTINNYYTGRGEKIRTEIGAHVSGNVVLKSTDYIAGLIWTKNTSATETPATLDFIPTVEGRAVLTTSIYGSNTAPTGLPVYKYEYHLKDHLGNLRAAYRCGDPKRDASGNIITGSEAGFEPVMLVQENHYDPWGVNFGTDSENQKSNFLTNKWQYNGKEKQTEAGLNWLDYGARFYDPFMGRWNAIDPMTDKMPFVTPYSYCFNNPIRFVDKDGKIPYPITIRAFAPFKTFGYGFHGDNRGYSTSSNATARLHQKIDFDTDKNTVYTSAWSSKTFLASDPSGAKTAKPSAEFTKGLSISKQGDSKSFDFATSVAAANPKTPPGTPDINVFSDFSITENKKAGTLSISGKLTGDNFPSTEAYITDQSGQNLFLGVGQINSDVGSNTGPFTELIGENRENPITSFNITISTDKKGNFTGVRSGGKTYEVADWNQRYSNTQPQRQ